MIPSGYWLELNKQTQELKIYFEHPKTSLKSDLDVMV